jgi:hypothetical protein
LRLSAWQHVLSTEEEAYTSDPLPPAFERQGAKQLFRFARPGAVVLRARGKSGT